jgi:catechol 2,3-dioxygenase-like lactoylglutathione lyase family enzyme
VQATAYSFRSASASAPLQLPAAPDAERQAVSARQCPPAAAISGENDMQIELDHTIVPSHHKVVSAKLLAELLGVPWAEAGLGPFSPVYVNEGLTLDFIETAEPFSIYHFCFRVSDEDFDAILGRIKAAGIKYRGSVRGLVDMQINTEYGGSMVYWNEPDGHQWEILTFSYARQPT